MQTNFDQTTFVPPSMDPVADLVPPADLAICFGGGEFLRLGGNLLARLVDWAGLKPWERVLDVGCGAGRAALPLTQYLNGRGSYEGFDIFPFGVDWCVEHITPRFPNFHFRTVQVRNNLYNPFAATEAGEFTFPYQDDSFDLAFLNSVFTHMLPEGVARYLAELGRVLAPGGRAFLTFFLMDDESLAGSADKQGSLPRHRLGRFWVADRSDLEEAVGYPPEFVDRLVRAAGLEVTGRHPGHWCGRKGRPNFQDALVCEKS